MFYQTTLKHNLYIPPDLLSSNISNSLISLLKDNVEGLPSQDYGYVISVLNVINVGEGEIQPDGYTIFHIKFQALILKLSKGEVVDTIVNECNKMGIFSSVGPITVFISNYQVPKDLERIERNTILRVKVIGIKVEKDKIFVIGTINEDFLGVI
ncbi:subunit 7 of RNA polymerase II [Tubulinosema ratisbonensis]|uniref:Subunit 7 of RNA polymerase II n=1 Tax=Tubulinosema ratisbonensis TaxID=291195 RepID=A0A437ALN3_9MICR|nr:subunit 7 of RNA polymerase II [Tubulinosema ratisbonensis]